MAEYGDDFVGHFIDVPEVNFQGIAKDFGDAGLFADDDGNMVIESFEWSDAERLGNAGHDVQAGHTESTVHFISAKKTGEEDLVADAHFGGHFDDSAGHVAGAGDDEFDVVHDVENFAGGGDEVVRAFLHGYSSQEQDDLLTFIDAADVSVAVGMLDAVVDDLDFLRVAAVVVDDDIPGEAADGDDLISLVDAHAFDVVYSLIHRISRTIELGAVDVDDEGHAFEACGGDTGWKGHPVVGVDNVEGFVLGDGADEPDVSVHF